MTNKDIKNAYVGTTPVKAMYLGSTKVYPTGPKGVYILDIDNKLFKKDKWDIKNNSKAMGVAVITDNCAFCIQIIEDGRLYPFTTLYDTEAVWIFLAYPSTPNLSGEDFSLTSDTATVRSFYPIDLSEVTVVQ